MSQWSIYLGAASVILYSNTWYVFSFIFCSSWNLSCPQQLQQLQSISGIKHALRQTAYLPNQSIFVSAVYHRTKLTFTPICFFLPVDHPKYALFCLNLVKLFLFFLIVQPLTHIITSLSSCFTERGAPVDAWIDGNINGRHCRQSSMSNTIGGAKPRTSFKLTIRGVNFIAFVSQAFFRLNNASNWSVSRPKRITVNVKALFKDRLLSKRRHGSGVMLFSVRRVWYR